MDLVSSRLSQAVARRMRELGVDIGELASRSGLSERYLREMLTDETWNPHLDRLEAVCLALDIKVSDLLDDALGIQGCASADSAPDSFSRSMGLSDYLGGAVRNMRNRNGISLGDAQRLCGVSKENLSHTENRMAQGRIPTADYLHLLSMGAGTSVGGLLVEMERMRSVALGEHGRKDGAEEENS